MKNVGIYVRVSTQEQAKHGISVDSQIVALTEYCKTNNYQIVKIYNDAGISARKKYTRRPALLDLLNDCRSGRIDIILFTKLDRWFRSVADYYQVQAILDECHIPWRAIWEDYETETSSGVFKVNIMLSVAQSEADRTSERIKAVNEYKRMRGDWVGGKALTGYAVENKQLIFDSEKYDAVKAFWDTFVKTLSTQQACKASAEHGLMLQKSHALKLAKNPTYHGDAYGYECPAYVTKEEQDLVLDSISKRTRTPIYEHDAYYFSGILYCGYCGKRMIAKTVHRTLSDGTPAKYKKYNCVNMSCPALNVSEKNIESFLLSNVSTLIESKNIEIMTANRSVNATAIGRKKVSLQKKLERIADLYEMGDITLDEYKAKRDSIKEEMVSIPTERQERIKELPSDWMRIYNELDSDHRQSFWRKVISKIIITNETKACPHIEFR